MNLLLTVSRYGWEYRCEVYTKSSRALKLLDNSLFKWATGVDWHFLSRPTFVSSLHLPSESIWAGTAEDSFPSDDGTHMPWPSPGQKYVNLMHVEQRERRALHLHLYDSWNVHNLSLLKPRLTIIDRPQECVHRLLRRVSPRRLQPSCLGCMVSGREAWSTLYPRKWALLSAHQGSRSQTSISYFWTFLPYFSIYYVRCSAKSKSKRRLPWSARLSADRARPELRVCLCHRRLTPCDGSHCQKKKIKTT